MMRRVLLAIAALLALALVAGCASGGDSSADPGDTSAADPTSMQSRIEAAYADAGWFAAIDTIETVSKLRHPVTEIRMGETVNTVRGGYLAEMQRDLVALPTDTYLWFDIYGTDGKAGAFGAGPPGVESVELPPAPASVDEFAAWMDEAYGPASGETVEPWFERITGYAYEPDGGDGQPALVIQTDLAHMDAQAAQDMEHAELIRLAASTSGVEWVSNVRVVFGDGVNADAASIGFYNPYEGY